MRKYKPFFAGMLVMISILALSGTALAASGQLQISGAGLVISDVVKVKPGDTYPVDGQQLPVTVSYTGTDGKLYYYMPAQVMKDYFNVPVSWSEKQNSIVLGTSTSSGASQKATSPNPTKPTIGAKVGPYKEIDAKTVNTKQPPSLIAHDGTHIQTVTGIHMDETFYLAGGKYVVLRVTNNGKERVTWRVGQPVRLGEPTYLPAVDIEPGHTLTRAFELDSSAIDGKNDFLSVIQGAEGTSGAVDVTYSLMQFK